MKQALVALVLVGCGGGSSTDGGAADLATSTEDDGGCAPEPEKLAGCAPLATDYQPRANLSRDDQWPACPCDDGAYHLIGPSVPGSAARVVAWEAIADRLWRRPAPSVADFLEARNQYATANGIGSRVERRQDIHYPEIPGNNKLKCSEMGVPEKHPARCVGPARLVPLINDAFQKGLAGTEPRVQAARIEAALFWFFYLSTLSEAWTCGFEALDDCDGVWSHWNGARRREERFGLGRYLDDVGPATRDRAFDGVLAVRCWRDQDKALPSTNPRLYQQALAQLDRAEVRGIALVLRERLGRIACATPDVKKAHHEFVKIVGGFLDRAAIDADAAKADLFRAQINAATPEAIEVAKAQALLDALFPCP